MMTDNSDEMATLEAEGVQVTPSVGLEIPPLTESESEVHQEVLDREALHALTDSLDTLQAHVRAQEADLQRDVRASYAEGYAEESSVAWDISATTVAPLRAAWRTYEESKERIATDRTLTEQGKAEAKDRAARVRDEEIARHGSVLGTRTDAVRAGSPKRTLPPPTPGLAAEAQLIYASFPMKAPRGFADEVIEVVNRASDPDASYESRLHQDQLLKHAYLPLCQKQATSTWALSPVYERLAGLISTHLATSLEDHRHDVASGVAQQAEDQFRWLNNQARSMDAWDELILSTGCTAFGFGEG